MPWHEYRDRFLTEKRIQQGTDFWMAHSETLRRIQDPNVAASVIGILGVETSYGRITGRYRVLDALATLAFDYPPRQDFFRSELQHFLLLSREESVIRRPRSARTPARWARRSSCPPATATSRSTATATASATCGTAGTT